MSDEPDSDGDLGQIHFRRADKHSHQNSHEIHRISIDKPRLSSRKKSRRRSSRHYVEGPPKKQDGYITDQDSDDMLDEYYGGTFLPELRLEQDGRPERISARPDPIYVRPTSMPQPLRPSAGSGVPPRPPPNGPPPPPPLSPSWSEEASSQGADPLRMSYGPAFRPSYLPPYMPYRRHSLMVPTRRHGFLRNPPHNRGLWGRAAVDNGRGGLKLTLKLVLTRHGERYKSHGFVYEKGTWDDFEFARRLTREYRRLKTDHIGLLQKLTAYKAISFVYFLQYHAFPASGYRHGRWQISDKKPISSRDDDRGKAFFMFKLRKKARSVSHLFHAIGDNGEKRGQKRSREWVSSLDELIEPGAVIDLEIRETFDSTKIYVGLLLVILLSLGAALGYGFGMNHDFSTGFSIASWLITAFGFFAAIVAAGEYFGLDSPTMTLWDADPLDKGNVLPADIYRDTAYLQDR